MHKAQSTEKNNTADIHSILIGSWIHSALSKDFGQFDGGGGGVCSGFSDDPLVCGVNELKLVANLGHSTHLHECD